MAARPLPHPDNAELSEPDMLDPEQIAVLKTASPDEIAFIVSFARNYLGGRKFACWGARAIVGLGAFAAALTGIVTFLRAVGWWK